jgi:hypothetical protein
VNRILKKQKRVASSYSIVLIQSLLVIFWGIFLGVFILSENLESLLLFKNVDFTWDPSPDFSTFFNLYDIIEIHPWWFMVKGGHFIGFAIMEVLLYWRLRNSIIAMIMSIMFATFTEILQLFFGRDGRLYDIVIDSLGVLIALYLLNKYLSFTKNGKI